MIGSVAMTVAHGDIAAALFGDEAKTEDGQTYMELSQALKALCVLVWDKWQGKRNAVAERKAMLYNDVLSTWKAVREFDEDDEEDAIAELDELKDALTQKMDAYRRFCEDYSGFWTEEELKWIEDPEEFVEATRFRDEMLGESGHASYLVRLLTVLLSPPGEEESPAVGQVFGPTE